MRFDIIPVHAVKSISQRNLAVHWQSLHSKLGIPRFADFSPGNRAHDPRQMLVWTIDERNGERSYRHLYGGAHVFEAFGPDASVASVPERIRAPFEAGLDACVTSACIIYMSIATSDPSGHRIECERLLLPFRNDGETVSHILASLQLVSHEGNFERRTIVRQFEREADVTFCGRIPPCPPRPQGAAKRTSSSQLA
jgi:hypothetical protein